MENKEPKGNMFVKGVMSFVLYIAAFICILLFVLPAIAIFTDKTTDILISQAISLSGIVGFAGVNFLRFKKGMKVIGAKDKSTPPLGIISGQVLGFIGLALFLFKFYIVGVIVLVCGMLLFSYFKFNISGIIKSLPDTDPAIVKRRLYGALMAMITIGAVGVVYFDSVLVAAGTAIVLSFMQLGMMSFSKQFEAIEKYLPEGATKEDEQREKEEADILFREGRNPASNSAMSNVMRKNQESAMVKGLYYPLMLLVSFFVGLIVVAPYIKVLKNSKNEPNLAN